MLHISAQLIDEKHAGQRERALPGSALLEVYPGAAEPL